MDAEILEKLMVAIDDAIMKNTMSIARIETHLDWIKWIAMALFGLLGFDRLKDYLTKKK